MTYPLSEEALEVAVEALRNADVDDEGWKTPTQAAINAFLAAEGFMVERQGGRLDQWEGREQWRLEHPRPHRIRLVGPWRPSEEQ